jgi:hypothetical protein
MSTILISGLPPATDPTPSTEPVDVDVDAPEPAEPTDASAEAEADTAEATPADDGVVTDPALTAPSVADFDPQLAAAAHAAAVDLVAVFKAEIAAFMPELIAQVVAAVMPKRGRPPGSKNRPKATAEAPRKPGRKPGRKAKGGRKKAR